MDGSRAVPTSRPSDRPTFTIRVDGRAISRAFHVLSVTVTRQVNRIAAARLTLADGDPSAQDFPASNADLFVPGREIEIHAGYHSDESRIFSGIVVRHAIRTRGNRPSLLTVDCRHPAVRMTLARRSRYFADITDGDLFSEIVGAYGLNAEAAATAVTHPRLVQYACTDWDFLLTRAEACGMLVTTPDGAVNVNPPNLSAQPILSLAYGAAILELDAEMDARTQIAALETRTWNMADQAMTTVQGARGGETRQGNIGGADLAGALSSQTAVLAHGGSLSEAEIKAWADARMARSGLSRLQGRVRCIGSADIQPGTLITLEGLGDRFNGVAFVSGVRHELGGGAWVTDAEFGLPNPVIAETRVIGPPPAAGLLPPVSGLQVGVVTQLGEDPDGEDRVQVRMPVVDEAAEGVWARVAAPDAGNHRSVFFRPEIGDEVVLGFLNDDPRTPVILGGLHSSARPSPIAASDANPEKGIVTRAGMRLIFNDESKIVTIETPSGNKAVLSDEAGGITLTDENGHTVTLGRDGITLESAADIVIKAAGDITLEAGAGIGLKAGAQLKAEGGGGAELVSSATTTIRGSMVMIN